VQTKITPGEIVVMAAGGVALIASFLPFWDPDFGDSVSAWGEGLFPVATLIMLYALAAGVLVALNKFANMDIAVMGFALLQLVLVLAVAAVLLAVAFLILDTQGIDKGIGYWLLLLSSIASIVGAILMTTERKSAGAGPGTV
jgi:hypothetical protein